VAKVLFGLDFKWVFILISLMRTNQYQGVIFDMDGVIVDSEPRHEKAFLEVCNDIGFGENHGMHFPNYLGRSDQVLWEDFIEKHQPEQSFEHLLEAKRQYFIKYLHEEKPIFPGVRELVQRFSGKYSLAVASGSLRTVIHEVLAVGELVDFFPIVISSQDVTHSKPAPDIFLLTLEKMELQANQVCVIEDTVAGVRAARAAGMDVVAITNTYSRNDLHEASHVVDTYQAIGQFID
jgi:HAD superfamily hydrolase (TIGR01509 family)